jgi:hypothetical protein
VLGSLKPFIIGGSIPLTSGNCCCCRGMIQFIINICAYLNDKWLVFYKSRAGIYPVLIVAETLFGITN